MTEISDSYSWNNQGAYSTNYLPNFKNNPNVNPNGGDLTLAELASWGDRKTGLTSSSPAPWDVTVSANDNLNSADNVLPAGGTLGIRYKFMLDPNTDDSFQGVGVTMNLKVMASQVLLTP